MKTEQNSDVILADQISIQQKIAGTKAAEARDHPNYGLMAVFGFKAKDDVDVDHGLRKIVEDIMGLPFSQLLSEKDKGSLVPPSVNYGCELRRFSEKVQQDSGDVVKRRNSKWDSGLDIFVRPMDAIGLNPSDREMYSVTPGIYNVSLELGFISDVLSTPNGCLGDEMLANRVENAITTFLSEYTDVSAFPDVPRRTRRDLSIGQFPGKRMVTVTDEDGITYVFGNDARYEHSANPDSPEFSQALHFENCNLRIEKPADGLVDVMYWGGIVGVARSNRREDGFQDMLDGSFELADKLMADPLLAIRGSSDRQVAKSLPRRFHAAEHFSAVLNNYVGGEQDA